MLLYELNKPDRNYKGLMQCEAMVQQREAVVRERSRAFQEQVHALVVKDFCARADALTITTEQQASLSAFSRRLGYPGLTWKGWCSSVSFTYEILAELEKIFFPEEP